MSNLNVNNVDVQRMISVLNDLDLKFQICSCFSFNNMQKIINRKDEIVKQFGNKIFSLLENHSNNMTSFREVHLTYKEARKEEKTDDDEEEESDLPNEITKEKQNLKELDLEIYESHPLSKSLRNLYRELNQNKSLLNYLKELRMDKDIINFSEDITYMVLSDVRKSKMTLEEEQSEIDLNQYLKGKILEMNEQIREKNSKLQKLQDDKKKFKTSCTNNIIDLKNHIDNLKINTKKDLQNLEDDINNELFKRSKEHEEDQNNLKLLFEKKEKEFKGRKMENADDEKANTNNLTNEENNYKKIIEQYDTDIREAKRNYEDMVKKLEEHESTIMELKMKRDNLKEHYELYNKNQKDYEEKVKKNENENQMEAFACNIIQNNFRGYVTRKTNKKKYGKILTGLKKIKPDMRSDAEKNAKGGKGNKGGKK